MKKNWIDTLILIEKTNNIRSTIVIAVQHLSQSAQYKNVQSEICPDLIKKQAVAHCEMHCSNQAAPALALAWYWFIQIASALKAD